MRAVLQRVKYGSVKINGKMVGEINNGIVVLVGVKEDDSILDVEYIAEKIVNLRIFEDDEEKMNLSLLDLKYELLIVSQFTLYGDCRKGRRPSFIESAKPEFAKDLYNKLIDKCKEYNVNIQTGEFQENMEVNIVNDGPVTIILDSDFRK